MKKREARVALDVERAKMVMKKEKERRKRRERREERISSSESDFESTSPHSEW